MGSHGPAPQSQLFNVASLNLNAVCLLSVCYTPSIRPLQTGADLSQHEGEARGLGAVPPCNQREIQWQKKLKQNKGMKAVGGVTAPNVGLQAVEALGQGSEWAT